MPTHQDFEEIGARLLKQPIQPNPFTLTDHRGNAFTQAQFSGRWSVVFFGYTHCADVCPTTLATLARVEERFAQMPQKSRPVFVFVSVDPQRDSLAVLREHVSFFSSALLGATGSQKELRALAGALGIHYDYMDRDTRARVDPETHAADDEYAVEHSSDLHVFAPDGSEVGLIFPPFEVARVERVIRMFMAR